ncbi:MAG: hypothetical protein JNJ45_09715 [Chthonomonas sp.]|nr:hypothetical protein [Chthonomonas sp.]
MIGMTGSGKTTCLTHLISGAILQQNSFVLLDARGDQVNDVLTLLAGRVEPSLVKVIDLRDSSPHIGFDPLGGFGLAHKRALNVASIIKDGADSFGVQLEETLRHFLTLPAEAGEPLTQLESALYDDLYRSWLLEQVESEHVRTFVWRYHQMRDDRKVSLAMPVMNKLSGIFATRKLRAILSDRNPVDLAGHLAQPGSILLVSLAVDETANLGRSFGSMILGCLTQAMFSRVGTAESQRNPVLLVLDEFSHFAGEDISAILAEGRRFRYSAILAHQALCQVSPALRSLVLGNVGLKVVFRLGRDDSGTMSADLTGDRKAIDFTRLPVGTCVIKRGSRELVGVEVNTPIGNGGVLDAGGRQLLAEIHSAHPNIPYSSPCLSLRASAGSTTDPGKKRRGQGPHQPSRANVISLEGWL